MNNNIELCPMGCGGERSRIKLCWKCKSTLACPECNKAIFPGLHPVVGYCVNCNLDFLERVHQLRKDKPVVNLEWPDTCVDLGKTFFPVVTSDTLARIVGYIVRTQEDEIAGFGRWDKETNKLVWAMEDEKADKSVGAVKSASGKVNLACFKETGQACNWQWHTHPGMGTYFSTTDKNDQIRLVLDLAKYTSDGEYVVSVFDQLQWYFLKLTWRDNVPVSREYGYAMIELADGTLTKLDFEKSRYRNRWNRGWTHTTSQFPATQPVSQPAFPFQDDEEDYIDYHHQIRGGK